MLMQAIKLSQKALKTFETQYAMQVTETHRTLSGTTGMAINRNKEGPKNHVRV